MTSQTTAGNCTNRKAHLRHLSKKSFVSMYHCGRLLHHTKGGGEVVAGVAGLEGLVGTGSGGIVHHKNIEVEDRFEQKECSVIFQERKGTKGGAKKKHR